MSSLDEIKRKPQYALTGISTVAALGFGVLASRTRKPRTILGDLRLRTRIPRYSRNAKKVAIPFGYLGKEKAVLPLAGVAGAKLLLEGRKAGAAAVIVASAAAIGASHLFDVILDQRTPPPGRRAPADPHFPSGHALHATALAGISAWVLAREGLVEKKTAATAAGVLALALGFDRLVQDRHWTSDVVAGWLAAVSIVGLVATGYESARPRRVKRAKSSARRKGNS